MLSKEQFIDFVLLGPQGAERSRGTPKHAASQVVEGFVGFDEEETAGLPQPGDSFARRLLEASGFGYAEMVQRDNVIRSTDAVAGYLPERISFWPKTTSRPYQTLLFEADLKHKQLLAIPAFRARKMAHLDIVEDALARLVSEALEGFQRGGAGVTADVRKGRMEETLCVVSILDGREGQLARLVCFGTLNKSTRGLETFQVSEHARFWDPPLARDHLGLLYERQFRKLAGSDWQESFSTTEEREQAEALLKICTRKTLSEHDIQEGVLDLLDTIAKGFGLRKKPKTERRLQAFRLPSDHDIGIDPDELENRRRGQNPFGGITLRDERSRLLGYIIYPLKAKDDARRLRKHLEANNRFHNVLVVYPDETQARFELWQGREQLTGKLRKGQGYRDAADVVNLLSRFFVVSKAKVRNPSELAEELAYRARYLRRLAVKELDEEQEEGPLRNLYRGFKEALVHDQTEDEFADAFAQTITYGLLTARWTGNAQLVAAGERFTRRIALKHLPSASPFLNELFRSILSFRLDEQRSRLLWLVDDIADLLDRVDVSYVFGVGDKDSDAATDPVIHFYEPFLAAYDKKLKNRRGVFFTPRAVVSYIVRAVHELLQSAFGLEDGLASVVTWEDVTAHVKELSLPEGVKASDPFVRILDPATGTGTFLYECIGVIEKTMKERWCRELGTQSWTHPEVRARWSAYVPNHLLPRLTGHELMMAPYSIAHLKLSLRLAETGYVTSGSERIHVYLTNSLEPPSDAQSILQGLAPALAEEAVAVNKKKRADRFTVVIGNPPYSNFGRLNRNPFILKCLEDYKRGLKERKINLDDDFIKFFRHGHYLVRRSGAGVLGLITNNSYLEGITHRRMREMLKQDFKAIRVIDLHGNARKAEVAEGGGVDENVFDIMQGVAIGIFSTHGTSGPKIALAHLRGSRQGKYRVLAGRVPGVPLFQEIKPSPPYFLFNRESGEDSRDYERGVPLSEVFRMYQSPIQTKRDGLTIHFTEAELAQVLTDLRTKQQAGVRAKYELAPDGRDWTLQAAIADVNKGDGSIIRLAYKPFDFRYTYYSGKTKGFLAYPRAAVMRHMLRPDARAFVFKRQGREDACGYTYFFVTDCPLSEGLFAIDPRGREFIAPLGLVSGQDEDEGRQHRLRAETAGDSHHNLSHSFLTRLSAELGLEQGEGGLPKGVQPAEIFHYAYAVVSSPTYRRRFEASLRVDFPRLPLTRNKALFMELAKLGRELVDVHVLAPRAVKRMGCAWVGGGPVRVEKVVYENGMVWLDKARTRGCRGVPQVAWEYWVGGYQVCEKWLKQRKGRTLSEDERNHFERVVAALVESHRLTTEIDDAIGKHGGWTRAFATSEDRGTA